MSHKNSFVVIQYETTLKSDKFLLIAHGSQDEITHASGVPGTTYEVEVAVHVSA